MLHQWLSLARVSSRTANKDDAFDVNHATADYPFPSSVRKTPKVKHTPASRHDPRCTLEQSLELWERCPTQLKTTSIAPDRRSLLSCSVMVLLST